MLSLKIIFLIVNIIMIIYIFGYIFYKKEQEKSFPSFAVRKKSLIKINIKIFKTLVKY